VDEAELERSTFEHLEAAGQEQEEEGEKSDKIEVDAEEAENEEEEEEEEEEEKQSKVDQFKTPLKKAKSKSGLTGLTETEIIAQGIFFLTAGYETSSSTISHALFELAQNQSAQARLYDELKTALDSLPSTTSRTSPEYFEAVLSRLPYLEAVLKETLRKYAPVQAVLRTTVTDGHRLENRLPLEKGQTIMIPVGAVHHCPEYYPEPQEFRPERFLPENAHLLVPYTWLPFGAGARNCIGMRFAMEEMKICLAALLENFEFSPAPNTPKELVFQR
ncbi:PREDICTED: cytochrome P450 3A19-like, partial [Rhagoletis zephyria]|uniref:cytochrome P450 3A19-like n=1 Tax=Rhagoletis zephyria TaxID=28612 RepID=UPI000811590B